MREYYVTFQPQNRTVQVEADTSLLDAIKKKLPSGSIEKVYAVDGQIMYKTIDDLPPCGVCGSGVIDLVAVLLKEGLINRSGGFLNRADPRFISVKGNTRFILVPGDETKNGKQHIYITESDIENIITAKAAIFATMKILLRRLDLSFDNIDRFYIAGAFGNYLNVENAVTIGLIPNIDRNKVEFMGNTSIKGAKIVAFYKEALRRMEKIREHTTYDDLMGAPDYVEEFQKAMFLPHTDIEIFERD